MFWCHLENSGPQLLYIWETSLISKYKSTFLDWNPLSKLLHDKIYANKAKIKQAMYLHLWPLTYSESPHPPDTLWFNACATISHQNHEKWESIVSVALGLTSRFPRTQSARWNERSEWHWLLSAQTAQFIISEIYIVISRLHSESLYAGRSWHILIIIGPSGVIRINILYFTV